jgi:branched-chain amino acid transport system ATP-binding protein
VLEITGLYTGYGDTPVLHDLNLQMKERDFVLILGPNGHGKTTLLRTISGLLKPQKGQIVFKGNDLASLTPDQIVKLGITHIPQGDLLFPESTVLENLWMGAYLPEAWKNRQKRADEVLEMFPQLKSRLNQLARTLSGGERRMLALSRGLMSSAQLYLIDEPSLGLAPITIKDLYEDIKALMDQGLSIILVEENATHAFNLAKKIYLLEGGRFVREGNPQELMNDQVFQTAYLGI